MGPGQGQLGCPHLLRGLLHVLVHPAALQGGHTGAALLKDLVICQDLEERVTFSGRPVSSSTMLSGERSMIFAL